MSKNIAHWRGAQMAKTLDRLDRRILEELQEDARISNQELAKRVGLSAAPCWRRLRRLEQAGFIAGYATLLRAPAIGLPILAASMEAYEHFLSTQLLQLQAVRSVNTSFVLRTKKFTTRLPVA